MNIKQIVALLLLTSSLPLLSMDEEKSLPNLYTNQLLLANPESDTETTQEDLSESEDENNNAITSHQQAHLVPLSQEKPVQLKSDIETKQDEFIAAIQERNLPKIKALLKTTPLLAALAQNQYGNALSQAALNGDAQTAFILLDAGVDPNAVVNYGTALMWALNGGNVLIIKRILDIPTLDINVQNPSGQTAMNWYWASDRINGNSEIRELLLQKGAKTQAELEAQKEEQK